MKRFLIMFMVLGLIAGSASTAGASKKMPKRVERTVEGEYGPVPEPLTGCNPGRTSFTCVVVEARPAETFFTAKITDAHGQPVFVQVLTKQGVRIGTFCGETTRPVPFEAGATLEFVIEPIPNFWSHWLLDWLGPLDCPYRLKTSGSISVTLSNLR